MSVVVQRNKLSQSYLFTSNLNIYFRVMGPAVHRLLEQFGLDAKEVPPSGPKGNLLKGDILNLVTQKGLQPKPPKQGNFITNVK